MATIRHTCRSKKHNITLAEICHKVYDETESLLMTACPGVDRDSEAFREEVLRVSTEAMIDAFVKGR